MARIIEIPPDYLTLGLLLEPALRVDLSGSFEDQSFRLTQRAETT